MAVEKLLPQNVNAEVGVLGSLLINPEAIEQVADFLRPEDFYREAHRMIFEAALALHEEGKPADHLMLEDELERRGKLEEIGGASYVFSLAYQVPTSLNIDYYADIVKRTSINRRLIHAAGQIAAVAYNEADHEISLDQAERLVQDVRTFSDGGKTHEARRVGDGLGAMLDEIEQAATAGVPMGTPTGLRVLDTHTGGLFRADLTILAARPGFGKTAMADTIAYNVASKGTPVLFFSAEMSERELRLRLLAMAAGVDAHNLSRTPQYLAHEDWEKLNEAAPDFERLPIYIDDTPSISLAQMRSVARRHIAKQHIGLVLMDYLQLATNGESQRRHENRNEEVGAIAQGLKNLAKELDVPVIALSQMSRAVETRADKKPLLSDLRESGGIEQAADSVWFIHREDVYDPNSDRKNQADIIIAKHRHGALGAVSLYFQAAQMRYRDFSTIDRY